MSGKATNIHGTAIVIGKTGLLFLGPSGSGKSSLAFACLAAAKPLGLSAALVADDQVFITQRDGATIADIAKLLFLSEGTVRNYLSSAISKTGTRNRVEALRVAEDNGWL